jgi:thiol-disulfide isomerase/thioredoxin
MGLSVTVLAAAVFGEGHSNAPPAQLPTISPPLAVRLNKPAPVFQLNDRTGQSVSSTNFTGKTLIVMFWASWDKPSQKQVEILKELQQEYGSSGFVPIGLCLDTRWPDAANEYAVSNSVSFPILRTDYETIHSFGGIEVIPTLFLIEPHGTMILRSEGVTPRVVLEPELKSVFNQSAN